MNQYVPDWSMEDNSNFKFPFSSINQKKPASPNNDFAELLWQNGHVVVNSQGHRKMPAVTGEFKQVEKTKPAQHYEQSIGHSSELIQDDGAASWFQYPLDETLDKEFCSEFFSEMAGIDAAGLDKLNKDAELGQPRCVKFGQINDSNVAAVNAQHHLITEHDNPLPSKLQLFGSSQPASRDESAGPLKLTNLSRPPTKDGISSSSGQFVKQGLSRGTKKGGQESSVMTVGSSICDSNQILHQIDPSCNLSNNAAEEAPGRGPENDKTRLPLERLRNNTYEATVTSSSGGSGSSIEATEVQNVTDRNHKRKAIALEESGSQSEDAEYESNEGKKPAHQSKSVRRSRAAEVHNLAERRRRDRINEKMKALQDLIPHCNKTDKASMLDEAIEYLKSLQLQVQMMWMGSGMAAPMMFPGVQQYMPGMGMGFGHTSLPSMHNAVQLPRAPFHNQSGVSGSTVNQSFLCPPPTFSGVNFPNQMPNIHLPDTYGRLFNIQHMQPQSQMMPQNHLAAAPSGSILPNAGGALCQSFSNSKSGNSNIFHAVNYRM